MLSVAENQKNNLKKHSQLKIFYFSQFFDQFKKECLPLLVYNQKRYYIAL